MKSYQVKDYEQPLTAVESDPPRPQGTEVLLEICASGLCHTDLHLQAGGYDLGQGRWLSFKERGLVLPRTPGHEIVGRVVAAGPEAGHVPAGRNFLVYPWIGCGTCFACKEENEHLCVQPRFIGLQRDGGYADHVIVPHRRYLLDIGPLDPVLMAPYACSGLTTFSALKKAGPAITKTPIVVIGSGGLGLMCIHLLKMMGGVGAIAVDIDKRKRSAAIEAGAIGAIDGAASDAGVQIQKLAGGGVSVVIDLVGSAGTANLGLQILGKGGKLILIGLFGGAIDLPLPPIPIRALSIIGSFVGNLAELTELLELVRSKGIPPFPVSRCSLHDANENLTMLREGKLVGRGVMVS
ncbi:MAG: alcohol dehydrogenase [Bradyrhizobium sp.]